MRTAVGVLLSCLSFSLVAGPLTQFGDRDTSQKPEISLTTALVGGTTRLTAHYRLPPAMHQSLQPDYFGLEVSPLPTGWTLGSTVYPPSSETVLGLPSWSGEFEVSRELTPAQPGQSLPRLGVTAKWQICFDDGVCLPPGESRFPIGGSFDWLLALSLALLGGLILNLMPCVLPVLALKLMAKPGPGSALATAAGIESGLLVLALVTVGVGAAGQSVGWGFQFQSPWYGLVLIAILVGLALEWWGLWSLPSLSWSRPASAKSSWRASYATGLLTVALATPCTAPFLGTALGLTLGAPPAAVLAVFATIGLGLALPFLLVAAFPQLSKLVPKPGRWMAWVPRIGGVALLATALWLGTVVWQQLTPVSGVSTAVELPAGWEPFNADVVRAAEKAGTPVLVEFTAAWCLTCQVNEAGVLSSAGFRQTVRESGTRLFWGDFTKPNEAISSWLREYGRVGVPFTLVLRSGTAAQVLPELLTEDVLKAALTR